MNSPKTSRSRWSPLRRLLLTLAIVATVIAAFYTEEDWRGKRDWENYKSQLEAQGWALDWNKRIPKPVPDDQNFYTASTNILIRFVKTRTDAEYAAATNLNWLTPNMKGFPERVFTKTNEPIVAEITVVTSNQKNIVPLDASELIDLRNAMGGDSLRNMIRQHIGTGVQGLAGLPFSEKDLNQLPPLNITIVTEAPQTGETLSKIIPPGLATNIGKLGINAGDHSGQFEVRLVAGGATPAARYLQWMDQFTPALDEVREALKRPYALIPGDYSQPWSRPIPNFVLLRWLAQFQGQRAQCHLLLNEPGPAVEDLTLVHDICRILEHQPEGHPMTLVEAMINVAIQSVYVAVVQQGFNSHTWREQDLAVLQKQLAQIDLHAPVIAGFEEEQLSAIYNGQRPDLIKILINERIIFQQPVTFLDWLGTWLYRAMPRGWYYENVKVATELNQKGFTVLSPTNQQVFPANVPRIATETDAVLHQHSPFTILASIAIPNYTKAAEAYAYTQTLVNEGQIACALERYKMSNGSYPDTLDKLTPTYIETLPMDVIGGQSLHYHRTNDGSFLLYSVGWNEADDGGTIARDKNGKEDRDHGDWVWHYQAN